MISTPPSPTTAANAPEKLLCYEVTLDEKEGRTPPTPLGLMHTQRVKLGWSEP